LTPRRQFIRLSQSGKMALGETTYCSADIGHMRFEREMAGVEPDSPAPRHENAARVRV
jgi:hypothetical protein